MFSSNRARDLSGGWDPVNRKFYRNCLGEISTTWQLNQQLIRLKTFIASLLPSSSAISIMTELCLSPEPAELVSGSSAVRPAGDNSWHRLAFYNIGWNHTSKK